MHNGFVGLVTQHGLELVTILPGDWYARSFVVKLLKKTIIVECGEDPAQRDECMENLGMLNSQLAYTFPKYCRSELR